MQPARSAPLLLIAPFFPRQASRHLCGQECVPAGILYWHYGGIVEVAWFEYHSHGHEEQVRKRHAANRTGLVGAGSRGGLPWQTFLSEEVPRLSRRERRNTIDRSMRRLDSLPVSRCRPQNWVNREPLHGTAMDHRAEVNQKFLVAELGDSRMDSSLEIERF